MSLVAVRNGERLPLPVFMISSQSGRFYIAALPKSWFVGLPEITGTQIPGLMGITAPQEQSNCFLVGCEFRFSRIEVQPICRQSSVVFLIHWRRDRSFRNARRIQSPK